MEEELRKMLESSKKITNSDMDVVKQIQAVGQNNLKKNNSMRLTREALNIKFR